MPFPGRQHLAHTAPAKETPLGKGSWPAEPTPLAKQASPTSLAEVGVVDLRRKLDRAATLQLGEDDEGNPQEPEETNDELPYVDDAARSQENCTCRHRRGDQGFEGGKRDLQRSEAIIADCMAGFTQKSEVDSAETPCFH